jgi:hypothetical protein
MRWARSHQHFHNDYKQHLFIDYQWNRSNYYLGCFYDIFNHIQGNYTNWNLQSRNWGMRS